MKAVALANRLARDIDEKSVSDLTADVRLEILDAINGALQRLDAIAPFQTKTTTASLYLEAAVTVAIGVTQGSVEITGTTFTGDQYGRTIHIDGDDIDNQISGTASLLHPYTGATGTVNAVIHSDAVALPEPYAELIGDPRILETGRDLIHHKIRSVTWHRKHLAEPRCYWVEANAGNRSPAAPAVIRFDTFPDRAYRLEVEAVLAPARVAFSDLLTPGPELPLRSEHVELYLLPIARSILTGSRLWKDKETKTSARDDGKAAEANYETLAPKTLATPRNIVRTKPGY
jgi:hypothetical protein